MPSPRTVDQWLAQLKTLELPAGVEELKKALAFDKAGAGIVLAAVARRIAEHHLTELAEPLALAFARLSDAKADPSCRGKIAIARALHDLDIWEERVFVAGLTIVQREGMRSEVTGKPDDTAGELRGICGLAHAHFARTDALDVLAQLLADEEPITRIAAARALGDSGRPDAGALLRYKLLAVDDDPEVHAACCESLLALSRDASEFLIRLLADHDARAEAAALALGGARITTALDALVTWCESCAPAQRQRVGYLVLALLRNDRANAFLVDAIATKSRGDVLAAGKALATFKDDPASRTLLRDAVARVKDASVRRELQALLAP